MVSILDVAWGKNWPTWMSIDIAKKNAGAVIERLYDCPRNVL